MPDTELREGEWQVQEAVQEVQKAVREEEVEEEVREDLLRGSILRAPLEPVVLVRDRDRVYGDCLPKSPQPATRAWRSPIHAFDKHALCRCAQHQHEERCVCRTRQR